MDFFDVLRKRRSVRAFSGKPIEREKSAKLLEAINSAPSAGNLQAFRVAKVRKKETRKKIARAAFGQSFAAEAPLVLVFLACPGESAKRYGARGEKLYSVQDATIAASYAQLSATALGLSTVWIGAFNGEEIKKALGAGEELTPVAVIPVGYAAESPGKAPRKELDEIIIEE